MTDKQTIKYLLKDRRVLEKQLRLAKKTILAFYDVYEAHRHGHTPSTDELAKLFQKCEDEMDLDDLT